MFRGHVHHRTRPPESELPAGGSVSQAGTEFFWFLHVRRPVLLVVRVVRRDGPFAPARGRQKVVAARLLRILALSLADSVQKLVTLPPTRSPSAV